MMNCYEFAQFHFCPRQRDLWCNGRPVRIQPRLCNLLALLLEHPFQLLGKDWLMEQLWPGIYVSDNNLSQSVSGLRRVLGCDGTRFIRTETRRGFRFVYPVSMVQSGSVSLTPVELEHARAATVPSASYTVAEESIENSSPPRPCSVIVATASCLPRYLPVSSE
jgi:DNA-binding winged helix-turn-helix (wHTH) protein